MSSDKQKFTIHHKPIPIVFVGVGLFPFRISGDKNFVWELACRLARRGDIKIICMGLNDYPRFYEKREGIEFYSFSRSWHCNSFPKYYKFSGDKIVGYHHKHAVPWENLEIVLALLKDIGTIKALLKKHNIAIVHVFDNLGLGGMLLRRLLPDCIHVSTIARYAPKNNLYDHYLRFGYGRSDAFIVYSEILASILPKLFPDSHKIKIMVQSWGCERLEEPSTKLNQRDTLRVIWAGFIQQIGRADFFRTVEVAKQILRRTSKIRFDFYLKPECFENDFKKLEERYLRIIRGRADFRSKLATYHVLLSPTLHPSWSMAPPLTWVEALSTGVSIATTRFLGCDEVIKNGENGWIFEDYLDLERRFLKVICNADFSAMHDRCIAVFEERYSMDKIVLRYCQFYEELLDERKLSC